MRVDYHYEEWEDWKGGMYRAVPNALFDELRTSAVELLSDPVGLDLHMRAVIHEWPNASEMAFTNTGRNPRTWLGQAACCHSSTAPEYVTRAAWGLLNTDQRRNANAVADAVIADWRVEGKLF